MVIETAPTKVSQEILFPIEADEFEFFDDMDPFQDAEDGSYAEVKPIRLWDMTDETIRSLYEQELLEDENTFAGFLFSDEEKAALFAELYGSKGYFVQVSHARARERGKSGVKQGWADGSEVKAQQQIKRIQALLKDKMLARSVPNEERGQMTARVIRAVQKHYSGKENQLFRASEIRRLKKVRESIGRAACEVSAAD